MAARGGLTEAELAMVRTVPLFGGLAADTVALLTTEARLVVYGTHTLLMSRGDPADRFFVVLAGRVRLFVLTVEGRESVIEFIGPGQSFAEAAVFGNCRVPVTADAEPGTRLLHVPAKPILAMVAEDAGVARAMMDSLARWQRHLVGRVGGFKVRTPGQRLAAALLALTGASDGAASVRLAVTKAGLASHIGITPESLSRAMARLRSIGVQCQGHDVSIADIAQLRRYSEDQPQDS